MQAASLVRKDAKYSPALDGPASSRRGPLIDPEPALPARGSAGTFESTLADARRSAVKPSAASSGVSSKRDPSAASIDSKARTEAKSRVDQTATRDDAGATPDDRKAADVATADGPTDADAADVTNAEGSTKAKKHDPKKDAEDAQNPTAAAAETAFAAAAGAATKAVDGISSANVPNPATGEIAGKEKAAKVKAATATDVPAEKRADADLVVTAAAAAAATPVATDDDSVVLTTDDTTTAGTADSRIQSAVDANAKPKAAASPAAAVAKTDEADGAQAAAQTVGAATPKREHPGDGEPHDQPRDADTAIAETGKGGDVTKGKSSAESTFDQLLSKLTPDADAVQTAAAPHVDATGTPTPLAAEHRFARENVENVVTSVKTQMNAGPAGGDQMRIRLDPPELGALEVAVKMVDGRMSASFTTSNDQATQLLSHSLDNLKSSLEASGISVDRIQVRQSSADNGAQQNNSGDAQQRNQGSGAYDPHSRQGEQQRREAVNKMWRKLAHGTDEVDLVA